MKILEMGEVFREGPYIWRVRSNDHPFEPHCHIKKTDVSEEGRVRFKDLSWMDDCTINPRKRADLIKITKEHLHELQEAWRTTRPS
jgi:hypothetical protein